MKRTIFLFLISVLFSGQTVLADNELNGTCLQYYDKECTQIKYCPSPSLNGCNFYETCTIEGDKFSCVAADGSSDKIIYRSKDFMDSQIRNIYKETYTSPIADEYMNHKNVNDKMGPSIWNHKQEKDMKGLQIQNYYHLDEHGNYNYIPRRDLQETNFKPPFNAFNKKLKQKDPRGWTLYH